MLFVDSVVQAHELKVMPAFSISLYDLLYPYGNITNMAVLVSNS